MPFVTEDGHRADPIGPKGKPGRRALSSLRLELLLSVIVGGSISSAFLYVAIVKPELDHEHWYLRLEESIKDLAKRRPPGMAHEQWVSAVKWTLNAHANCCGRPEFLKTRDQAELLRFAEELRHRLRGPVDLKTIDWIWDKFERISKYGKEYSDEWRPGRGSHQPAFLIN